MSRTHQHLYRDAHAHGKRGGAGMYTGSGENGQGVESNPRGFPRSIISMNVTVTFRDMDSPALFVQKENGSHFGSRFLFNPS